MSATVPSVLTVSGLAPEMLVSAMRDAQLEPCLLNSRPAASRIARLTCPHGCLDFAALGPAVHTTGEMALACYTLVFVLACPAKGLSINFSTAHTDGYMGFFPPGGMLDAVTPEGYSQASLTVPAVEFHAALEQHFPEAPAKVLRGGALMLIGPVAQARLRGLLAHLEEALWHTPELFAGSLIRRQVERELLAGFFSALRSGCADLVKPPSNRVGGRLRRLRQAREFLAAHTHEPIYLDDLCATLGITRRGVEKLFQDLLGLSPITYQRHQRLHGVRRALLHAAPASGAVKNAALRWGFLHQGRFAHDYRSLFGESPSDTLTS